MLRSWCCNHAATGAGRIRTDQENYGARKTETRSYMPDFPTGSTHAENLDLTYKEGVAGSTLASPTLKPVQPPLTASAERVVAGSLLRSWRTSGREGSGTPRAVSVASAYQLLTRTITSKGPPWTWAGPRSPGPFLSSSDRSGGAVPYECMGSISLQSLG